MVADLTPREKALIAMTIEDMRRRFADMLEGMAQDAPPDMVLPVAQTLLIAAAAQRALNEDDYPAGAAA